MWATLLPKWKGYKLRQEVAVLGGGAESHKIKKVPINEVAAWDAEHDATGRLRSTGVITNNYVHEKPAPGTSAVVESKD